MFSVFFYQLKHSDIPVSPTALLTLHHALSTGLINNLNDFYIASRCILVKSEKYFDIFDQIFSHHFNGTELPKTQTLELDKIAKEMLIEWLKDPELIDISLGLKAYDSSLKKMTPDELIEYFKKRLHDQRERHDGGNKWIGTGGQSPTGHSGFHPEGMRVGGTSRKKSALKVALERRYKTYNTSAPITKTLIHEALKKLKFLSPSGPRTQINIRDTISQTIKNGGEIELCFDRKLKDQLKVVLAIDNGGWSMDPYVPIVQTMFHHSRALFKEVKTYFFHNTIYQTIWKDPKRLSKPVNIKNLARKNDKNTRLIIVGDASMAPYEIMAKNGSIYLDNQEKKENQNSSIDCLRFLAKTYFKSVWLNPISRNWWTNTKTIGIINSIFPMFELSIDGLDKAVKYMISE